MSVKTATVVRAEIETVEDLREVMSECMNAWASNPFEVAKLDAYVTGLASRKTKEPPTTTAAIAAEGSEHHG